MKEIGTKLLEISFFAFLNLIIITGRVYKLRLPKLTSFLVFNFIYFIKVSKYLPA